MNTTKKLELLKQLLDLEDLDDDFEPYGGELHYNDLIEDFATEAATYTSEKTNKHDRRKALSLMLCGIYREVLGIHMRLDRGCSCGCDCGDNCDCEEEEPRITKVRIKVKKNKKD